MCIYKKINKKRIFDVYMITSCVGKNVLILCAYVPKLMQLGRSEISVGGKREWKKRYQKNNCRFQE